MHLSQLLLAALPLPILQPAAKANIVLSNDDGWAEINIRQFYYALTKAGNSVIISAPADNESGTGSADFPAKKRLTPCEFDSCPAGSPAVGFNASMKRFSYVNSYPVTSMRYGIQTLAPEFFGAQPDIAVAGFNVGSNMGTTVLISGTVGAATEAVKEGIPAIAFSGRTGHQTAWNADVLNYEAVYAELSANITQTLINTGKPYLPPNIWLNVNFPSVSATACTSPSDFKFVLSRIYTAVKGLTPDDAITCHNGGRLPTERAVVGTPGCFASISVGEAVQKADANATSQAFVLEKFGAMLSCLP